MKERVLVATALDVWSIGLCVWAVNRGKWMDGADLALLHGLVIIVFLAIALLLFIHFSSSFYPITPSDYPPPPSAQTGNLEHQIAHSLDSIAFDLN